MYLFIFLVLRICMCKSLTPSPQTATSTLPPLYNKSHPKTTLQRINSNPSLYNTRGNVYYFAIGSNMLKSKLVGRGLGNASICV